MATKKYASLESLQIFKENADKIYATQTSLDEKVSVNRTINGKSLTMDISLLASDVGAATEAHNHNDVYYTEAEVEEKLAEKSNISHSHDDIYYTKETTEIKLADKANLVHNHNDVYYTESEIDAKLAEKSNVSHSHDDVYYIKDDIDGMFDDVYQDAKGYTNKSIKDLASISDVQSKISAHNTDTTSHNDIRVLIQELITKLNNFLDVDEETTDQLSEVLTLINNNKGTLESLTTNKINVSDIIDNLTTANSEKVLSANQGVEIKKLIDALQIAVNGKANSTHSHTIDDVTNLQSSLEGKQTTITGAATTITSNDLETNRALVSDGDGKVAVSAVTSTELSYLDGVTSNVQTQLNGKASTSHNHTTHSQSWMNNTDLNTIKTAGWYAGYTGMTNAPEQTISVMEVLVYSNDWIVQRFIVVNGDEYIRHWHKGTTWTDWAKTLHQGDRIEGDLVSDGFVESRSLRAYSYNFQTAIRETDSWYRIYSSGSNSNGSGEATCIFTLGRSYNVPQNENYCFSVSVSYNSDISITQLSGIRGNEHIIDKIRVVHSNSKQYYIDFLLKDYVRNDTRFNHTLYVYGIGSGYFQKPTLVADELESGYASYEFETVKGCKSDKGFTGSLSGNATTATQDASGNVITSTYETKTDATTKLTEAKNYTDTQVSIKAGVKTKGDTYIDGSGNTITCGNGEKFNNYRDIIFMAGNHSDGNIASGDYSHAEGDKTKASGYASHAEGCRTTASGYESHAEGFGNTASGNYSHAEGLDNSASGIGSHVEGQNNTVDGSCSHAEGQNNVVSCSYSHVEGENNTVDAFYSHAEGQNNTVRYDYSHVEGQNNTTDGYCSHVEGCNNTAYDYQHVQGHYCNNSYSMKGNGSGTVGTAFIIGNGTSSTELGASNAFRVTYSGQPYAKSSLTTTGCDYAEFFEWQDLNPNNKDRRGYFVTLDGEQIKIAEPNDYILGIISGLPSVIGNGDESWMGRYVFDEFGDFIYEDFEYTVEVPEEVIEESVDKETGKVITETKSIMKTVTKTGKKYKENPNYDPSKEYIQRQDRPEWDCVGMLGVLSVRDDGTCKVNGYCNVSEGGIATASESGYRVIKRVNDNIIKVVFK